MKQANSDYLEANYDCINEVRNAQTATKAFKIRGELLRIMKEEWLPGYVYSDECGSCLFDMTNLVFRYYDDWKGRQPKPTDPVPIESVKATFPSHKEMNAEVEPIVFDDSKTPPEVINKPNKKNHRR